MKNSFYLLALLVLVLISSCKKSTNFQYGWWTFQSTTFSNSFCNFDTGYHDLNATNQTVSNQNTAVTLQIYFNHNATIVNGSYIVCGSGYPQPPVNEVSILYATSPPWSPVYYQSAGGNPANQKIQVSVSNGKISASGSGIILVNQNNVSDTSLISFNITQIK